jgi:hypothetical protein
METGTLFQVLIFGSAGFWLPENGTLFRSLAGRNGVPASG